MIVNIDGRVSETTSVSGIIGAKSVNGSFLPSRSINVDIYIPQLLNYSPEALALFDRMTVAPSKGLMDLIDKTITDLKDAGIWQITDKFHKWDLHTEQASLLDWKNSAHNATNVYGATFTPKYGLATVYNTNYVDLNFTPSTDCVNASLNDFAFSLDDLTGEPTLYFNFGSHDTANTSYLIFRTMEIASVRMWLYINSKIQKVWNNAAGINLYYNERPDASSIFIYKSPTLYTNGTGNASTGMVNQSLVLGGIRQYTGTVTKYNISTSTFWLGKCFTAEQRAAWYDIINYWKANIGSAF